MVNGKQRHFVTDANRAEKGVPRHDPVHGKDDERRRVPTKAKKRSGGDGGGSGNLKKPNSAIEILRSRSPIWAIYLKDATEQAQDSAQLWQATLDALLVFAGLFAGVLASFVVDARSDLLSDADKVLLGDIRNGVRNQTAEEFTPGQNAVWINGLWFSSLLITLFTAVVGGIAKSWFVKFATASSRHESRDAYNRWVLDDRRWRLERAIAIVPCLLHLSLLLFCVGFAIQSLGDHPILGKIMLGLVVLGALIYTAMTLAPFWYPDHPLPLRTPLSDLILGIKEIMSNPRSDSEAVADPYFPKDPQCTQEHKVLATICRTKLLMSMNPAYVDAAVVELGQLLNDDWLEYFIQHGVAELCIERLHECMEGIPFRDDHSSRDTILRHHLRALLFFRSWAERRSRAPQTNPEAAPVHKTFLKTLNKYIEAPNIFNRWNNLSDPTRPLAFSLRIGIYLDAGQDFTREEMKETPWETIVPYIYIPTQRLYFAMAACHGLESDAKCPNLKSACALSISLSIVNAARNDACSEWPEGPEGKDCTASFTRARYYLHILLKQLASQWLHVLINNLEALPSVAIAGFDVPDESEGANPLAPPTSLGSAFIHNNPIIRSREIGTVKALFSQVTSNEGHSVPFPIVGVLHMALNDPEHITRKAALECLEPLAFGQVADIDINGISNVLCKPYHDGVSNEVLEQVIDKLIPLLQNVLGPAMKGCMEESMKARDANVVIHLLHRLPVLCRLIDNRTHFLSTVVVPSVVPHQNQQVRNAGRRALQNCMKTPNFQDISVESLRTSVVQTVKEAINTRRPSDLMFDILCELVIFEKVGLGEITIEFIKPVTSMISRYHGDDNRQRRIADIFTSWSEDGGNVSLISQSLEETTPDGFGPLLETQDFHLRMKWVKILSRFVQGAKSVKAVEQLIATGINDDESLVRLHAVELLLDSVQWQGHTESERELLKNTMENKLKAVLKLSMIKTSDLKTCLGSLDMLATLLRYRLYTDFAWSHLKTLVGDDISNTLSGLSAEAVVSDEFIDTVTSALPTDLRSMACNEMADVRILFVNVLSLIAQSEPGTDTTVHISTTVSCVLPWLVSFARRDPNSDVKISAISAIGKIVEVNPNAKDEIKFPIPNDQDPRVRLAWAKVIGGLTPGTHDSVVWLIEMTKDADVDVRCETLRALSCLVSPNNERDFELIKAASFDLLDTPPCVRCAWADTFATVEQLITLALTDPSEVVRSTSRDRLARTTTEAYFSTMLHAHTEEMVASHPFYKALKNIGNPTQCHRAFLILQTLSSNPKLIRELGSVIKPIVPHILRVSFQEDTVPLSGTARCILEDISRWKLPDLNSAILYNLPKFIEKTNDNGRAVILKFVDSLDVSNYSYELAATDLVHTLKNGHWHSKRTVIQLLSKFYSKCEAAKSTCPDVMQPYIDDLSALALDDRDDGVRASSLLLLIKLCRESRYRSRIKSLRVRLMALLEIRSLRSLAAELISLLCKNPLARFRLASWILTSVAADMKENQMEGISEMLSRLILDERLRVREQPPRPNISNEQDDRVVALDYVLLLLASVLMMRPSLISYQFHFATSLWRNYRHLGDSGTTGASLNIPDSVVKWFLFIVFGNHVTGTEVEEWLGLQTN